MHRESVLHLLCPQMDTVVGGRHFAVSCDHGLHRQRAANSWVRSSDILARFHRVSLPLPQFLCPRPQFLYIRRLLCMGGLIQRLISALMHLTNVQVYPLRKNIGVERIGQLRDISSFIAKSVLNPKCLDQRTGVLPLTQFLFLPGRWESSKTETQIEWE